MTGPILVFGHRNPDNDSICSAVGYAHLKNVTDPANVYVPARLGPPPAETEWVFARFGAEMPEELEHVHARVRDVMSADVVSVTPEATMLEAGRLMRERDVRALPVVEDGVVKGLVNQRMLAERFIDETALAGFADVPVAVAQLVSVLEGTLLAGDGGRELSGNVLIGAMEPDTMLGWIRPGDTLIVGDRRRTQPMALEAGVACLVVTGGHKPDPAVLELAQERSAAVVSTALDTYAAARRINLSHVVGRFMETSVLVVEPDDLLAEAVEDLLGSPHREALVVDRDGELVGILTRTNVAHRWRRRVVLVDHNEYSQSAVGIEEAEVVEVVDHHRVGDVQTAGPILFLGLPVGSTATIVADRYRETETAPPPSVAGLLLSAVLSDTVLLKSPTTTELDRDVVEWLSGICGEAPVELGMEMFRARTVGSRFSAEAAVRGDLKEYRVGEARVAVAQLETVDAEEVLAHRPALLGAMEAVRETRGFDLVLLMVTDVLREGSELIAVGKVRLAERAFGVPFPDGTAWMAGVLSRKKQVAAKLLEAAGQ